MTAIGTALHAAIAAELINPGRSDAADRARKLFECARVDAFVVNGLGSGSDLNVASVVAALRENGLRVERAYGDRSVKAQWKVADKSRAAFGVMLGKAEAERGAVAVKDLRTGIQVEVAREALAAWLQSRREEEEGTAE